MRVRVSALMLAILFVAAASPSYAQITAGAKVGVNWSTITEEEEDGESDDNGWKSGLAIVAFVDVPIHSMFSIAPEFLYTQKGAKNEFDDLGFDFEQKVKLDFIQIPVLLKVAPQGVTTRPFFVVGPAFGFLTRARFVENFDGDETDEDIEDEVKGTEFSIVFGGGVHIGPAIVELRYDHGLNNLSEEDDFEEAKTKTFSVLFGIGF